MSDEMRIVAERLAACGLEVRVDRSGDDPGLLAVTNPVTEHSAEVSFEDDGPTFWQVWGDAAEGTGAGWIADEIKRLLTGDPPDSPAPADSAGLVGMRERSGS